MKMDARTVPIVPASPPSRKDGAFEYLTTRKDELVRNVIRVIDEHAPRFSSGIIDMQVLTPPDIEARAQFMGTLGMWTSGLFVLVILAQAVPTFVLHPCQ